MDFQQNPGRMPESRPQSSRLSPQMYNSLQTKSHKGLVIGICSAVLIAGLAGGGGIWYWQSHKSGDNSQIDDPAGYDSQFGFSEYDTNSDSSSNNKQDSAFNTSSESGTKESEIKTEKSSVVFELGEPVTLDASVFLPGENTADWTIASDLMTSSNYSYNQASHQVVSKNQKYLAKGTYEVTLTNKSGITRKLSFTVKDTKAPVFNGFASSVSIEQKAQNIKLENYWSAQDIDQVVLNVRGQVDFQTPGTYLVKVIAEDASGNKSEKDAEVRIVESQQVQTGGVALTKTKDGKVPLSSQTNDIIRNNKIPEATIAAVTEDKNDKTIRDAAERAVQAFENEINRAKELAMIEQNQTGWYQDGNVYMQKGTPVTGAQTIDEQQYFFTNSGTKYKGWKSEGDSFTYYDDDGVLSTGSRIINGGTYYFGDDGIMITGWRTDDDGKVYYYDSNGMQRFGEIVIGEGRYYLDSDTGQRYSGFRVKTAPDGTASTYYYQPDGQMAFKEQVINGETYYFDEFTGAMESGLVKIVEEDEDGAIRTVFMDKDGKMQSGWISIDDKMYYFDGNQNGAMRYGLLKTEEGVFYLDPVSGAKTTGWVTLADGIRFFDPDAGGAMATGYKTIDGDQYLFDAGGVMQAGTRKIGRYYHYFDPETGKGVKDQAVKIAPEYSPDEKEHTWYFDASGRQGTGLKEINEKLYFFDPAKGGEMAANQIIEVNGVTYNFGEDGGMRTDCFIMQNGMKTFIQRDGTKTTTGWITLDHHGKDNGTYYLVNGHPVLNSLYDVENVTYGFDADGRKLTAGTHKMDGFNLKFDTEGRVQSGWMLYNGKMTYCTLDHYLMRTEAHETDRDYDIYTDKEGNVTRITLRGVKTWAQGSYDKYKDGNYMCIPVSLGGMVSFYDRSSNDSQDNDQWPYLLREELMKQNLYAAGQGSYNPEGAFSYVAGRHGFKGRMIGANADAVRTTLKQGGFIAFVTTQQPFVTSGSLHCMVAYNYDSAGDKVFIHDPYAPQTNSKTYTVDELVSFMETSAPRRAYSFTR